MKSYPDSHEIEYLCNLLGFEENVIRVSRFFILNLEVNLKFILFSFRFGSKTKEQETRTEINIIFIFFCL